ncbi:MAG TPA: tetratricopeptide repeat protein [Patescibacteria group bacterium]|nr:tetratricopeptide repeat protein [Patescibacteria group bacterium]
MNVALPPARTLVAAGALALVVLAAAAGGWYWYAGQQRRVAAAYAEVMTRVYAAQSPQAPPEARARAQQELEQLLAQHPSAAPVAEAAYELGNLRYAARQWAPARGAYEIALARGHGPTVRTLARTSIGYTWEAERDWGKAVDAFQAVARDLGPKDFLFDEVQFALARVQELGGRPAEAIATYRRVVKDTPSSVRADEAKQHLMRLGAPAQK